MLARAFLILVVLGWGTSVGATAVPKAQSGQMDLTAWSWAGGPVALDGEWLFEGAPETVPSGLKFADGTPYGQGTYQLTLRLPTGSPPLALRLPIIGTAMELAVDGQVLDRRGVVGSDTHNAVPYYRPSLVTLPTDRSTLVLTLRVSNWHDQFAGIYYPIRLGTVQDLVLERERAALTEALLFGAILLMGIYHLGFFLFRTGNRSALWFAVLCVMVALRSTLYSEVIFLDAFPDASWWVVIRGVYLTMTFGVVAFVLYLKYVFPHLAWKPLELAAYVVCGVFGVLNLLAPLSWTTTLLPVMQVFIVVAGLGGLVMVVRALLLREAGAGLFVTGISVFLVTLLLDIVKTWWFLPFPSLVNVGMLAFLLLQALVVTRQFSNAFLQVEQINQSLERFIPREVLGFLGKTTITEIALGDYAELRMTVFFLDIRDFTALSETMTPKQNFRFINSFLKLFGPVIREHNGFVDKYLGDGLMALFPGSPVDAVRAALQMRENLRTYNLGRQNGGYAAIRFGIGIHTGPLMLGTIGENQRMDSTVISDTVNASSRLEGLTKKYVCDILVSGATVEAVSGAVAAEPGTEPEPHFEFVARETVKGKTEAIDVYKVV